MSDRIPVGDRIKTRWDGLSLTRKVSYPLVVLAGGALLGSLTFTWFGVLWGLSLALFMLVATAGYVFWREPSKTILAQFFFLPLLLLGGQGVSNVVSPLAPLPQIGTFPLMLWAVIVCLVIHRFAVPRKWLRALIVVQIAALGGWLFGMALGPYGVFVGYLLSASVLYVFTFGWAGVQRFAIRRRMNELIKQDEQSPSFASVDTAMLTSGLDADKWTVVEKVRPGGRRDIFTFDAVVAGPRGVFAVCGIHADGVVRQTAAGVRAGRTNLEGALMQAAAASESLAKRLRVSGDWVVPVVVVKGASVHRGRMTIGLFDGDTEVFKVAVVRPDSLIPEITDPGRPLRPAGEADKVQAKLLGLSSISAPETLVGASEGISDADTAQHQS